MLVLGDLHLFARRSKGEAIWDSLTGRLAEEGAPSRCVFLGDLFDFSWATSHSPSEAVREACRRVRRVAEANPDTRFDYLLGNHDMKPAFLDGLAGLARELPNVVIHPHHLQIGEVLFLHGDVVDRPHLTPSSLQAHRARWAERPVHTGIRERLYGLLVRLRIDEVGGLLLFPPPLVLRRLHRYVARCGLEGVAHVVFGHTHRRVDGVLSRGVRFTNLGAPIGHRAFAPEVIAIAGEERA